MGQIGLPLAAEKALSLAEISETRTAGAKARVDSK
jgi:hypothetical protein